jgi:hypothetical protein
MPSWHLLCVETEVPFMHAEEEVNSENAIVCHQRVVRIHVECGE